MVNLLSHTAFKSLNDQKMVRRLDDIPYCISHGYNVLRDCFPAYSRRNTFILVDFKAIDQLYFDKNSFTIPNNKFFIDPFSWPSNFS